MEKDRPQKGTKAKGKERVHTVIRLHEDDNGDNLPQDFMEEVYRHVAQIPFGKVATYGQIAAMAGCASAARETGHIMSQVKEWQNLPCHRVVNKSGTLAPDYAFGGKEVQQELLEKEGIAFIDDHIDMSRHLWNGPEQLTLF